MGITDEAGITRNVFMRSSLNKILFLLQNFGDELSISHLRGMWNR